MKFKTAELRRAVSALMPIVPPQTPKEILKWIQITPSKIRVSGTDISKATKTVNGEGAGSVLLNARTLHHLLSTATSEEIEIVIEPNTVRLYAGTALWNIPQMIDEFPEQDQSDLVKLASLTGAELTTAIRNCLVSVNDADTQYSIASIGISWPLFYSTDMSSAAIVRVADGEPSDEQHLLMGDTAKKLNFDNEEEVEIFANDSGIGFRSSSTGMFCRKPEGILHKAWKILPDEFDTIIDCDPEELQAALKQSAITTNPESEGVTFKFSDGKLTLRTSGVDKGNTVVSIDCSIDGDDREFILHGTKVMKYMSRTDKNRPLTIGIAQGRNGTIAVFKQCDKYQYAIVETRLE